MPRKDPAAYYAANRAEAKAYAEAHREEINASARARRKAKRAALEASPDFPARQAAIRAKRVAALDRARMAARPKATHCKSGKHLKSAETFDPRHGCKLCAAERAARPEVKAKAAAYRAAHPLIPKPKKPMVTKTCAVCSAEFTTNQPAKLYCSRLCKKRASNNRHQPPKPKVTKTCERCGASFETSCTSQKFCSERCSESVKEQRRRDRRIPWITKLCLYCSSPFRTKQEEHKFCSRTCSKKQHQKELWESSPDIYMPDGRRWWQEYPTEAKAYNAAKKRCTDTNSKSWGYYGGRGIEFRFTSLPQFIDALKTDDNPTGKRPEGKHASGVALYSLDRRDNDGHYEAGNIRWATPEQQANNKRPRYTVKKPPAPVRNGAEKAVPA